MAFGRKFVKINRETHYQWRAVHREDEVLESFVTRRRDRKAALKFLRKSMERFGQADVVVTDRLKSCGAAMKVSGISLRQKTGRWLNNQAESSHLPFRRREQAMLRFRRFRSLQKFAAIHSSIRNHFDQGRHLYSRANFKLQRSATLHQWLQIWTSPVFVPLRLLIYAAFASKAKGLLQPKAECFRRAL